MQMPTANEVILHDSYGAAKSKAYEYASDPEKLGRLIESATQNMQSQSTPGFAKIMGSLLAACRMIQAWVRREYTLVPWNTVLLLVASIVYWLCPADMIPDVIVGIGWLDDAALLSWTLQSIKSDIEEFLAWEKFKDDRNKMLCSG